MEIERLGEPGIPASIAARAGRGHLGPAGLAGTLKRPMYETRQQRLLGRRHFTHRLLWHALAVLALLCGSLLVGIAGYARFEHLGLLDAFLNAAMLLGGMGPLHAPQTPAGKLFAGLYALYSGLVFLVVAAVMFAPVLHRVMHRLHWEDKD